MKQTVKLFIFAFLLSSMSALAQNSPKWRVINLNTEFGSSLTGISGNTGIFTTSASLFYELENDWAITSWNGYSTQYGQIENNWLSNELMARKQLNNGFSMSFGVRRNVGIPNLPGNLSNVRVVFGVIKVGYRIKLK